MQIITDIMFTNCWGVSVQIGRFIAKSHHLSTWESAASITVDTTMTTHSGCSPRARCRKRTFIACMADRLDTLSP